LDGWTAIKPRRETGVTSPVTVKGSDKNIVGVKRWIIRVNNSDSHSLQLWRFL